MVSQLLSSPQFAAFVSGLALTVLWAAVGKVGRFLEAQGAARKIVALVVVGKQLEALGYDGDKLKGKPGAPELNAAPIVTINSSATAEALTAVVNKAVADALASNKAGS